MAVGGTNYGRLRQRQGTVASLSAANPVLAFGEFTITYDGDDPVVKLGDAIRPWLELPNIAGSGGGGGGLVIVQAAEPAMDVGQLWYDTDAGV